MYLFLSAFLILLVGDISAQVTFNPSNPANGAVVTNPNVVINISLGTISNIVTYQVLLNDYNKYQVGKPIEDMSWQTGFRPFTTNVTFKKNIMADSVLTGSNQYIMRIYGDIWTTGNNVTRNELHASDNVYYRKYSNYFFLDGDPTKPYTQTSDINVWKSGVGETGSKIASSPSTLLKIMENPSLPKDNPSSYFKTASSEANTLGAGAYWDMTKEPWITWFPDSCPSEGSTTPCVKNDYDGNHNGVRTCTNGRWGACGGFTDYIETQICAGASLSPRRCYFIDPINGNDTTGDGSMANPWKNLSTVFMMNDILPTKASLSGSGKKTVVLREGTFNVCQSGGSAVCIDIYGSYNNILIRSFPGESPKIVAPAFDNFVNPMVAMRVGSWGSPPGVYNIIIDGLEIQGGSFFTFKFSDTFNNITLRNCKIHNTGVDVIGSKSYVSENNKNNTIENCEIYNSSSTTISDGGNTYLPFTHSDEGIDIMGNGGLTIRNNYIHDITGNCLYYKEGSRNALVENNFCYHTGNAYGDIKNISINWGHYSPNTPMKIFDIYGGVSPAWFDIDSSSLYAFSGDYFSKTLSSALDGTGNWAKYGPINEFNWFILDLGGEYPISMFRGRSYNGGDPLSVDIYVSSDAINWGSPVASKISTWKNNQSWVEIDSTDKVGRYVLINVTQVESESIYDAYCGIWLGEAEDPGVDPPYPNIHSLIGGVVRNNILANCSGNAFRAMGAKDAEFYNNTLYNNDRPHLAGYGWGAETFGGGFAAAMGSLKWWNPSDPAPIVIQKNGLFNFASQNVILSWDGVNQTRIITQASMNTVPRLINHTLNNDWYAKVNLTAGTHTYYAWVLENSGAYHQTETRTITYLPGASPDVNGDGKVNVIDLAIVIYNQGHKSTDGNWNNYDHLDLDSDNAVDFDDVKIVMSSII